MVFTLAFSKASATLFRNRSRSRWSIVASWIKPDDILMYESATSVTCKSRPTLFCNIVIIFAVETMKIFKQFNILNKSRRLIQTEQRTLFTILLLYFRSNHFVSNSHFCHHQLNFLTCLITVPNIYLFIKTHSFIHSYDSFMKSNQSPHLLTKWKFDTFDTFSYLYVSMSFDQLW